MGTAPWEGKVSFFLVRRFGTTLGSIDAGRGVHVMQAAFKAFSESDLIDDVEFGEGVGLWGNGLQVGVRAWLARGHCISGIEVLILSQDCSAPHKQ